MSQGRAGIGTCGPHGTMRAVLEQSMDDTMVRERVEDARLALHGWHDVIETGQMQVFDAARCGWVQAAQAGAGPCLSHVQAPQPAAYPPA